MDPVSVVALVGFGLQVTDIIKRLLEFLDQVKDAPSSVERLKIELQILEGIINAAIEDDKQKLEDASERTWKAYQKALEAVSQQCQSILQLLEKTMAKKGMSRRKRLISSVSYVFREEEFTKLVEGLERAKSSFQLAQLCITNESSARNNRLLQQTSLQLYELTQAIIEKGDWSTVSDASNLSIAAWKMLSLDSTNTGNVILKHVERRRQVDSELNKSGRKPQETAQASTENFSATSLPSGTPSDASTGTASNTAASQIADRFEPQSSLTELDLGGFVYVKLQDRFSILKTKTEATMFHSPLLGTVVVTRRRMITKKWNAEAQQYEPEQEGIQTDIRIRPAPWLFSAAYEIRAEKIMTRYGSSNLSIVLETLSYAPISDMLDIQSGNLAELQTLLSARKFSLRDRDERNEKTLLGLSIEALTSDWFYAGCNPEEEVEKATHSADIVRTCRWLVSQGLTYDFQPDDPFITGFMHLGSPANSYNALKQVQEYESLLLESTDSSPCLQRAKMLLLFGFQNEEHSQQLRSTVVDLMQEAAVDHGPDILASDEKAFWADSDFINPGIVSVIMGSMLHVARTPSPSLQSERRKALKGPRRILYRMINTLGRGASSEADREDFVKCMSVLLRICRSLAPLDDGFGAHLTDVVGGNGPLLELWRDSLRRAGYKPERFLGPERDGENAHRMGGSSALPPAEPQEFRSCTASGPISSKPAGRLDAQSSCEHPSWTDLDAVTACFTSLELAPDPAADSHPAEAQSKGLVSRIATVGLEFVTSIL